MQNIKKNSIILFLITLVVLFFVIKDDFYNIIAALSEANIFFILLGLLFTIGYWFFKSLALHRIIREYKKDIKVREIFKQMTITQFFNGVTPFASGGQPFQVYMLGKTGLKYTHSTNIIVQEFIMYQMSLITLGVIAVILNLKFQFLESNPLLRNLTLIGFIINTVIGLGLLFVSFSKRFNSFVVNNIITLFSKIKIIKNKDKTIKSWKIKLKEFNDCAELFKNNKLLILKVYLYNIVGLLCYYLTPLFVIYSLGFGDSITLMATFVSCAYVTVIGSFVPIPGGSGGIEYSFLQFFGNFIKGSGLSAVLIVWRSITYYFAIIVGGLTFNTFKGVEEKCE